MKTETVKNFTRKVCGKLLYFFFAGYRYLSLAVITGILQDTHIPNLKPFLHQTVPHSKPLKHYTNTAEIYSPVLKLKKGAVIIFKTGENGIYKWNREELPALSARN